MKYRILILVLILALSILCSCNPKHTHNFSQEYAHNETHHWRACECGAKHWNAEHSWDEGVVTVHPTIESEGLRTLTCTVCNYVKEEVIERLPSDHDHTYDTKAHDEHTHWIECVCGAKQNETAHTWNGGAITTPAGELDMGIITYTCTECGQRGTENIPSTTDSGLSFLQSTHYRMTNKLSATPLTIEADIFVDPSISGRAGAVFGNYYGIRQDWLLEIYENGVPRFYYSDAAGNVKDIRFNNVDVRTGDWAHIALTFDFEARIVSFYLNGEIAEIVAIETDIAPDVTRYQFVLGGDNRSNNGIYFKGQIRSVAAYSDVRTAEEIAHSAQKGANLYADDLIVAYLLSANSVGKDIKDLSGNGFDIPREWLDSHEVELDYAYSFAVVGDTQWMSKYASGKMEGIYDWIIANKDSKKIAHVFGLGDITEDWNTAGKEAEWIKAQQYISKLDGVIPYSLIRGNHDESKYFLKYFATEAYMSQFDGFIAEGDIRNSYKLFTVGETDYLFLTLDYGASDEMLEWANEIVLSYPDHRVIVTTHGYHGFDGGHLNYDNTPSSGNITSASDVDTSVGDNGARGYNNGQQIWEKFISQHPNIFLVMSGHTPMEDVFVLESEGVHGNVVTQMLIDPQWMDPQKGGVGMVCMLYFSADGTQMEVEWLSTDTGKHYKEMNQFQLDLTDSLNSPAHSFYDSYNETYHYKECECGYTYGEEAHTFDGGVLGADGFMVYSCECGYKRITSASDDPIALALQDLLSKYYNGGAYYKESDVTYFYNGEKFWAANADEVISTEGYLTLNDLVMGRYGDLRLDLGWNYYDGVYSSANADTIEGVAMFVKNLKTGEQGSITKVTVEEVGSQLIFKLWANDSVEAQATVGVYATLTLKDLAGDVLGTAYAKSNADGFCEFTAPAISGYVAEYDKLILSIVHDELERTVYYSTVSVWDGTSVSTGLQGSGTESDPFLIQSGADLAYIRDIVNAAAAQTPNFSGKYFKMTQSIDLNGHSLAIGSYPGWGSRRGFYGLFDGNHCTIRGLNNTSSLFGTIEGGHLIDLSVYGSVKGGSTIGGIVGYAANGGKLENLTSYVTVTGENTLGGVVGNAENQASTVKNCVNYGSITGTSWIVGGVVGSAGHDVIDCVNHGVVTSTSDCVGGIAGSTKTTGTISGCINYGKVIAKGKTGGIVGQTNKPISNCINYADVNGTWAVGGIVGYIKAGDSSNIKDCINNGNVTGQTTAIGGILGLSENGAGIVIITGCVNNGDASTPSWGCGGIAGDTHGSVIDCVNNGSLTAAGEVGGIVGKALGKVTGCTNNGKVTGKQAIVGGIVGNLHDASFGKIIYTTNENNGTLEGPDAQNMIGKGYVHVEDGEENTEMKGINHRGWYQAPENTLSAYRESYNHGFKYVECDVQFTKDGIPVLLHDDTIDRTSNGSGTLSQMTYAEVSQYDFSYDDKDTVNDFSAYRGEKIPTFEEFIALCKELGLHPYIEIKGSITEAEAKVLMDIVVAAGMQDNVSWLAFSGEALAKVVALDDTARVVWVLTDTNAAKIEANNVPFAQSTLMTGKNEVVFDLYYTLANQSVIELLKGLDIPLEVWTVNSTDAILALHPYVTGVSSDMYDAEQVLAEAK